jgi:type I restriction enzyme S subunit
MKWPVVLLGDLFDISSSKRVLQRDWKTEGVPFYRAREIVKLAKNGYVENDLYITEEHYIALQKENGTPKKDDLMISAVGTLGACYLVGTNDRFYYKDASVLRFSPKTQLCSKYFVHAFQTSLILDQVNAGGGATVGTYTIERAKKTKIALPPIAEQQRIAALLDAADRILKQRESAIAKLDQLAQSVFVDMFGDPKSTTLWDRKEIGKLGKIYTGKTPSTSDQSNFDGDVPFVTPTDLHGVIKESTRKISHKGAEKITVVRSGSSLVGCIGDVGRVGYVLTPVAFNQQINAVDWNNELVLDVYGFHVLQYMASVFKNKSVSAVVPILNKTNFSSVDIPVPSLNEQIKFVNFINSLWSLKEKMISERESDLVSSLQHQSFAVN